MAGASLETDWMPQLSKQTRLPSTPVESAPGLPGPTLMLTGEDGGVIRGGSVSETFTVCTALLTCPATSATLQVTSVSPTGNTAGASFFMDRTPKLSLQSGLSSIAADPAPQIPVSQAAVSGEGLMITGASLSYMVFRMLVKE